MISEMIKKFPSVLLKPEVHYRVHMSPPLDPILRKINLAHILKCFCKILPCNLFPSLPIFVILFRFSDENFVCISHLSFSCYMPHIYHPSWLCRPHNKPIWWKWNLLNSSHCSLLHSPVTSPILGTNILLSTLF